MTSNIEGELTVSTEWRDEGYGRRSNGESKNLRLVNSESSRVAEGNALFAWSRLVRQELLQSDEGGSLIRRVLDLILCSYAPNPGEKQV
jgi:hypothetical protein